LLLFRKIEMVPRTTSASLFKSNTRNLSQISGNIPVGAGMSTLKTEIMITENQPRISTERAGMSTPIFLMTTRTSRHQSWIECRTDIRDRIVMHLPASNEVMAIRYSRFIFVREENSGRYMWMKEEGKGNIRTGTIDALGKNYYYILAGCS